MSEQRLIDANALKEVLKSGCENCSDAKTNWCEHCCKINDFEDLIDNAPTVEPFTQLEKEEIADAINYLLDAELLEENGYTEEVINALKSALKKVGGTENG